MMTFKGTFTPNGSIWSQGFRVQVSRFWNMRARVLLWVIVANHGKL